MIQKRLADITAADIQALTDNGACETVTLEFKRDLPGGGDEAKKEFLADVSALANTSGGDLLFGIQEDNGCASAISGTCGQEQIDGELLRLSNILSSGLEPRVRYASHVIPCPEGNVLLLRIEKSWNAPHRVIFKGYDKFFARASTGKYSLDVQQLRRAFIDNGAVADRMRSFRADRLANIIAGVMPVSTNPGPKLVLHLLPFESFFSNPQFDLRRDMSQYSQPLSGISWGERLTFDGKIVTAYAGDAPAPSYTQIYRSGVIEMVDASTLTRAIPGQQRLIPSLAVERQIVTGVQRGIQIMQHIGVTAPVAVAVTLTDVGGMVMGLNDPWNHVMHPILNTHLFFPEAVFNEFTDRIGPLLKPVFDLLWNACGLTESPNFDADGNWRGR